MWPDVHPAAGHSHLPAFIPDPGGTDVLMSVMAVFLVVAVLWSATCSCACTRCRNGWRTGRTSCSSRSSRCWDL